MESFIDLKMKRKISKLNWIWAQTNFSFFFFFSNWVCAICHALVETFWLTNFWYHLTDWNCLKQNVIKFSQFYSQIQNFPKSDQPFRSVGFDWLRAKFLNLVNCDRIQSYGSDLVIFLTQGTILNLSTFTGRDFLLNAEWMWMCATRATPQKYKRGVQ